MLVLGHGMDFNFSLRRLYGSSRCSLVNAEAPEVLGSSQTSEHSGRGHFCGTAVHMHQCSLTYPMKINQLAFKPSGMAMKQQSNTYKLLARLHVWLYTNSRLLEQQVSHIETNQH